MTRTDSTLAGFDAALRREGFGLLAGLDEAGRGCLAGPVVAAAVILREGTHLPDVDDSKKLTPAARGVQARLVRERAWAVGVSFIGPRVVDAINIRQASLLAMRRALRRARVGQDRDPQTRGLALLALVDGVDELVGLDCPQRSLVSGDARSLAVAAASVIAKTARDSFMIRLAKDHPEYGFEHHKGYGTVEHLRALALHGPCAWHRYSFSPIAQTDLFAPLGSPS